MLSTGTTTFLNHSVTSTTAADVAASIEPFADMGIRQVFCKELRVGSGRDEDRAIADLEEVIRRWDDPRERMVTVGAVIETGAHWLKTGVTSEELIRRGSRVAAGRGLRISDHITGASIWRAIAARIRSEGRNDIEHLMGLGVLGPHWILVHCTWINDREIKFCAESGAHVVVCPASGAYTAGGAAPIRTFLAEGLSVALGSDGPMVNDSVDMVEQMKHTALLQNIRYLTPAAVSSEQLIEMTTLSGARVLGLADEIGTIEVGKRADIAVFDMSGWHWGVPLRPHAALVFAGKGTDAKHVLVNGVFRVRDGQPQATGRLIGSVRHEARERAEALVQHAGLTSLLQRGWSPHRADREERHTNGESARRETRHDG
jgi:5-methylthioadenosine/S-adenosylhomocysteine deaminase